VARQALRPAAILPATSWGDVLSCSWPRDSTAADNSASQAASEGEPQNR
ncbi:unnamed protein product, partial [Amoebophrya sp. A25]